MRWLDIIGLAAQGLWLFAVGMMVLTERGRRKAFRVLVEAHNDEHVKLWEALKAQGLVHNMMMSNLIVFAGRAGVLTDEEREAWEQARTKIGHADPPH